MYRLNSLNADIQLIVDGAWENRLTILFIALHSPTAHQRTDASKG